MRRLLAVAGVLVAFFAPVVLATQASAHPTDELLQLVFVTPTAAGLTIDIQLAPGVLVAPAFLQLVDTDGDHIISQAEAAAYAARVADVLTITIDGRPVPLSVAHTQYPAPAVLSVGGLPILLKLAAHAPQTRAARTVTLVDGYRPVKTRTIVNFGPGPDAPVTATSTERGDDGRRLTVRYLPAASAPAATDGDTTVATPGGAPAAPYLLDALRRPLTSPWALATLLLACAGLGALHALTPGHGKALLAGYLVGDRGTPRQAVALGVVITTTHTASVIGIGVITLLASRYVLPGVLVPTLELGAGLLVVALGVRLFARRWRERGHGYDHPHLPDHGHDRDHSHDHHHSHDQEPSARGVSSKIALATMGVSGGIVPCPEALAVLLLAIAVHRTPLGLGMVVAFSAGLAAVLVVLGLVLVTPSLGRWLRLHSPGGRRVTFLLPLVSAAVVAALGLGMTLTGAETLITG
jgi:ABC-type nickel/cobalt efflux system permease component RcnA